MMGNCYWITGLSGAGKTSAGRQLVSLLESKKRSVVILDGDEMRAALRNEAYSRTDRIQLGFQYARLAKLIVSQGPDVVVSVIALFHEIHLWNKENIPNYFEVFLDVPIDELVRRDSKHLYSKYRDGQIANIVGMDLDVEFPLKPDMHVRWSEKLTPDLIARDIFQKSF